MVHSALSRGPERNVSKLYERAAEAVKKRNYDYAIELFIQELTLEPNAVDARRALRAAEIKKFQEAGKDMASGRALLQGLPTVIAAAIHRVFKNYEKLMLDMEQLLKRAPRHAGLLAKLGEAAVAAGHQDAAIVAFEELREADRDSAVALRGLARLHKAKGDLGKALAYYEQLKRASPADPEASKAVRDLAAAGATKRVEDAKAAAGADGSFRDVLKDKDKAEALEQQQHRVRTEADVDAAVKRLEGELAKAGGNDGKILKQLGDLFVKKKDFEEAISYYERSIAARPDPLVADALGDLKIKQLDEEVAIHKEAAKKNEPHAKGKYKDAKERLNALRIDEYRRRVEDRPSELGLRFQLGQFLVKADRFDEAIAELQKAIQDPRRGLQARLLLGQCFAQKGMLDQAIKQFEKAREGSKTMDDATKDVTYNLGLVLEKAGQKEKATAEFEKIIEVDINYKDAMKRLEALKA
jgi:tetratricopeptide (TPR) repeat protein